jgi:hypothetical protein
LDAVTFLLHDFGRQHYEQFAQKVFCISDGGDGDFNFRRPDRGFHFGSTSANGSQRAAQRKACAARPKASPPASSSINSLD